jgi:hypothetical protein
MRLKGGVINTPPFLLVWQKNKIHGESLILWESHDSDEQTIMYYRGNLCLRIF